MFKHKKKEIENLHLQISYFWPWIQSKVLFLQLMKMAGLLEVMAVDEKVQVVHQKIVNLLMGSSFASYERLRQMDWEMDHEPFAPC